MPTSKKYDMSFFTATILEWKHLLANDAYKSIIANSLKYLVDTGKIYVHAFVIMSNHIHILWHIREPNRREDVQRDFLRYTAQMILKDLRNNNPEQQNEYLVGAKDRKYQIWERNPLSVAIWHEDVMKQKLIYIHFNPVKAGLCSRPEEYSYSSAGFYYRANDDFGFLMSCL